jgi:hypothetical protein
MFNAVALSAIFGLNNLFFNGIQEGVAVVIALGTSGILNSAQHKVIAFNFV